MLANVIIQFSQLLFPILDFADGINFPVDGNTISAGTNVVTDTNGILGAFINLNEPFNIFLLIGAILLIVITIAIAMFLKKIVINAILGGIAFILAYVVFGIQLPLIPGIIISLLFGPAGVGVMLLLKFFGIL